MYVCVYIYNHICVCVVPKGTKPHTIMHIHNWFIDIHKLIMDIQNSIMDIHKSIMDIHN